MSDENQFFLTTNNFYFALFSNYNLILYIYTYKSTLYTLISLTLINKLLTMQHTCHLKIHTPTVNGHQKDKKKKKRKVHFKCALCGNHVFNYGQANDNIN